MNVLFLDIAATLVASTLLRALTVIRNRMNKKISLIPVILLVAEFAGGAGAESLDRIVAVVEDEIILRSELDRSLANVVQQFQAAGQPLPSRNVLERQILESLAMIKLKLQNARATGIIISDQEVD